MGYIQNLKEIRHAVWLLQGDLHIDLQWPPRSDLTSSAPHNLGVSNNSYFMKFLDWRPPSAQKLHFKVLGIAMGTFWAPLPKIWHAQKKGRGPEGIHTKFERDSSSGLVSRQKWRYFLNNNKKKKKNNNNNNSMCSKVCRLRRSSFDVVVGWKLERYLGRIFEKFLDRFLSRIGLAVFICRATLDVVQIHILSGAADRQEIPKISTSARQTEILCRRGSN